MIMIIKGPIKRDIKRQTWDGTHGGPKSGPIYLSTACARGRKCTVRRAGTKATTRNWDKWTVCPAPSSFVLSLLLFSNWDWFLHLKIYVPVSVMRTFLSSFCWRSRCCLPASTTHTLVCWLCFWKDQFNFYCVARSPCSGQICCHVVLVFCLSCEADTEISSEATTWSTPGFSFLF